MSLSGSAQCSVHLPTSTVYPGDPVEGFVTIRVLKPFPVRNIHIKIVGKERVNAMVDHVSQSKTKDVQFGITTQDYVYYREITTLVGDLLSVKRDSSRKYLDSRGGGGEPEAGGMDPNAPAGAGEENLSFVLDSPAMTEATATDAGNPQINRSFAITGASLLAALEGGYVTLPEGNYVFPFRYLLPAELPPTYDTGVKVRDKQFSNSMSHLAYYVKVYVMSEKKLLSSSSAFFTVKPMQPIASNRTFLGCHGRRLTAESKVVEGRFDVNAGVGCCSGGGGDRTLVVKMMLEKEYYEIDKDIVKVVCVVVKNTTGKTIQGVRLSLIQNLTFKTVKANVPMSSTVLSKETSLKIEPGEEKKCIAATLPKIPIRDDLMPTMCTTGLAVDYDIRVDVLANTRVVCDPFCVFEGVVLAAPVDVTAAPPSGEMSFVALPRGRLSRREAYYAVPTNPVCEPQLPVVQPASAWPSRGPSRRSSMFARIQ